MSKYENRPSPPVSAQQSPGQKRKGNDGSWWISTPNARGVYRWNKFTIEPKSDRKEKPAASKYVEIHFLVSVVPYEEDGGVGSRLHAKDKKEVIGRVNNALLSDRGLKAKCKITSESKGDILSIQILDQGRQLNREIVDSFVDSDGFDWGVGHSESGNIAAKFLALILPKKK